MRLLHLLPRPSAPEGPQSEGLHRALALMSTLEERGHSCASWSPLSAGLDAALELTTFVRSLSEIDLVHNHAGLWALPPLTQSGLPSVSSLAASPTAAEKSYLESLEPAPVLVPATKLEAGASQLAELESLYTETLEHSRTEAVNSRFDERPWGRYWVLDDQPTFKVKRITVDPGGRLSYQRHRRRSEHWVFAKGRAKVTLDGVDHDLGPGDDIRIPAGCAHRVQNVGPEPVTFIEVQSGDYFGEDDIERLSDDYGRAPA